MKLWTKEQRRVLGIGGKEEKLIAVLFKNGWQNTTLVAIEAGIPRVTALRILGRLKKRGFVTSRARGRAVEWSAVPPADIEKNLIKLFVTDEYVSSPATLSEVGSLTIFRGAEGIIETNRRIINAAMGERLLAIEPNGIWKYVAKSSQDTWTHLNTLFKEQKIQVEMITEEGFEQHLGIVNPELRHTFLDIITDISVVPERLLDSATEILLFRDQIFFIDWAHEVAVEIKNPSTMRVMRAMFRVLQESGRKVK